MKREKEKDLRLTLHASRITEAVVQIIGLDHIQLAMPPGGEAKARQFYGQMLGLAEVPKPEPLASRGGCWFEGPGTVVHLNGRPANRTRSPI